MIYRAEIDGLRALAVIPVILFHAGFELFSGGFVGVDVFFVISGYLITTILIDDLEKKQFNIVSFYERRARRILPALTVVSLVSVVFAWILLSDTSINKFGDALIGVSTFISNIIFWQQQGYFSESAELNPLLHTWSLAVEEQYYLLFPIFLILTWRFEKERVFWVIVVMTAISLLASEWGWRNKANANFYLAPTRAWELFAGSITAFVVKKRGIQSNNLIATIGMVAIFYSFLFYDKSTPFPSVYTIVPVLGVVLLVIYADTKTFVAKLLSNKILVGIGLISYSAYLWHQPFFAYSRHITNQIHLAYGLRFLLILATFIMAYFSWRYIEKPFRNKSAISQKSIFVISFVSLVGLFFLGLASKKVAENSHYLLAKTLSENDFVNFQNMDERKFLKGRLMYPLNQVDYLFIGSSRIMQVSSETIGKPILNLSVSGASIEDLIIFSLEGVTKVGAKNIFLGVDPWLLNINDDQNRYKSINDIYKHWIERIIYKKPPENYVNSKIINDIPSHSLLLKLRNKLHKTTRLIPKDGKAGLYDKKAYDGFHIYKKSDENKKRDNIKGYPDELNYAMNNFDYDLKSEENLQLLIDYLKNLDVAVTLVLLPYDPDAYQLIKLNKPIIIDIENKFRKISQQHNIKIIGSYDGNVIGCKRDEFYDNIHPKEICIRKIFGDF